MISYGPKPASGLLNHVISFNANANFTGASFIRVPFYIADTSGPYSIVIFVDVIRFDLKIWRSESVLITPTSIREFTFWLECLKAELTYAALPLRSRIRPFFRIRITSCSLDENLLGSIHTIKFLFIGTSSNRPHSRNFFFVPQYILWSTTPPLPNIGESSASRLFR